MTRVLLLPGASGAGAFWQPVAARLPADWATTCLDWPGLGNIPAHADVHGIDDLVELVVRHADDGAVDLVAQSMGGLVAIKTALRRPDLVRRLVLSGTSGGIDLRPFDVEDWRPEYRAEYPHAAAWITEHVSEDLSDRLAEIRARTLLLWGSNDTISPPAVGAYLAARLPNATLQVVDGGDHMFARDMADQVAPLIVRHFRDP